MNNLEHELNKTTSIRKKGLIFMNANEYQKLEVYYTKISHIETVYRIRQMIQEGWHIDSIADHQNVLYVIYSKSKED